MEIVDSSEIERQPIDSLGFVFIGPSGSGKSTLRKEISKLNIDGHSFVEYQPVTSRQRRPGEDEYRFVDDSEFDRLLGSKNTLFSNSSYENRFLTTWPVALEQGQHYLYIYLPQAAQELKRTFPNTKLIQVIPSDLSVLEERIRRRDPNISPAELRRRLTSAEAEISEGQQLADLVFVNDQPLVQSTVRLADELKGIIAA